MSNRVERTAEEGAAQNAQLWTEKNVKIADLVVLTDERRGKTNLAVRFGVRDDFFEFRRRSDVHLVEKDKAKLDFLQLAHHFLPRRTANVVVHRKHVVRRQNDRRLINVILPIPREDAEETVRLAATIVMRHARIRPELELSLPLHHRHVARAQH